MRRLRLRSLQVPGSGRDELLGVSEPQACAASSGGTRARRRGPSSRASRFPTESITTSSVASAAVSRARVRGGARAAATRLRTRRRQRTSRSRAARVPFAEGRRPRRLASAGCARSPTSACSSRATPPVTCPDCGGPKVRKAKRCRRCRNRHDYGTIYVNGRPLELTCPDCGGPKKLKRASRCRACANSLSLEKGLCERGAGPIRVDRGPRLEEMPEMSEPQPSPS